ncbi:hypothetical protein CCP3SC1AL1_1230002 [Gammaproteobacteria bacterium]
MKTKKVVEAVSKAVAVSSQSLSGLAYEYQGAYVDMLTTAKKILHRVPNILTKPNDNDVAEIKLGFARRFKEWYAKDHDTFNMVVDNKMQQVTEAEFNDAKNKNKVKVHMTIGLAMGYTQQRFTTLAKSDPYIYVLAKPLRKKAKDHISKGWTNLLSSVRQVAGIENPKKGRAVKSIIKAFGDNIMTLKARIKTAEARGDELLTATVKKEFSSWLSQGEALIKKFNK